MEMTAAERTRRATELLEELAVWRDDPDSELEVFESIVRDLTTIGMPWAWISNAVAAVTGAEPCGHLWDDSQVPGYDRVCLVCGLLT